MADGRLEDTDDLKKMDREMYRRIGRETDGNFSEPPYLNREYNAAPFEQLANVI